MSWQVFLTISILAGVAQTLLQRTFLKDKDSNPIVYVILSQFIAAILLSIVAITQNITFPNLTPFIPNLILAFILFGISIPLWFKSLKIIEASEFTVLFATRALWSIVMALIFLGEIFYFRQFVGTFLILASVILVSWKKSTKFKLGKGEVMALIAAAAFGSQFVNDGIMLREIDAFVYVPMIFIISSLATTIFYPKEALKSFEVLRSKRVIQVIILGLIAATSAFCYMSAYQVGRNAAQIAALNQTQIILTVIFAIIFLKEKTNLLIKMIAAILSFIGVLLIK